MERKTKHESGSIPRFFRVVLALISIFWLSPHARAQSETDVKNRIQASGHSESEVRQKIQDSGLTPEEVRRKLKDAGYNPDALDDYLPGDKTGSHGVIGNRQPVPIESPAETDSAPTSHPIQPEQAEIEPAPVPEFTKEIFVRVPGSSPVLPFGYDIFRYAPSTFEPLATGPVDPDYPIGPGDELVISVWGDNQYTYNSVVTREATISVPDIGQVVVNGLTLAQAKRLITDRFSLVYSGIRSRRPTTFVDVTLGKLRTNQVFILGDVTRPGGYTISSVSTVLNALYSAGGPTPRGSMRDVRIIRNNVIFRHVDLYGYILTGSRAEDVRLQSGDVVFVPPIGRVAAILGEVHRPAIYELTRDEGFQDLLRLSGGVLTTAVVDRALIDRIVPFAARDSLSGQDRIALDLPLRSILSDSTRNPAVMDRDIVQVFRIGDTRRNTVEISGRPVIHPGVFQWRRGMRVSDLVADAGGLDPDAYLNRAQLFRTNPDLTRSMRSFNLAKAIAHNPDDNLELQELDSVAVASVWDIRDRHTVMIGGSVRKPGRYEYLDGMTVMDLIFRAGGLMESAYKMQAEISRVDSSTIATTKAAAVYQVPIRGDYALHSADSSFALQKWDQVFVREIPDWELQRNVTITGEVMYPGVYSLKLKEERLSSLLQRSGGLKPSAYPRAATFVRKKGNAGRLAVDVQDVARKRGGKYDLVLEDGDAIDIPREPKSVKVTGEVGFPSSVLYENGRSLGEYIDQAGGYTEKSDKSRVRLIQPGGKVRSPKKLWWDPMPEPGALIVVPAKPPEQKKETLKDVATIVGIISGAVTTIFLAHEASK